MKRTIRLANPAAPVLLAAALLGACATNEEGKAPPLDGLHFPTGLALASDGAGRPRLFVASSNADLRYRAGALHVLDLDAVDALADAAVPPEGCPPGPDGLPSRCRTPEVADLTPAIVGAVELGNFSGAVAVASLPDRLRAFVPVRDGDGVIAVDLPEGGAPACTHGGGDRCARAVRFPGRDPSPIRLIAGTVYVANIRTVGADGYLGYAAPDDPLWTAGGVLPAVRLGDEGAGGIAASCAPVAPGAPECSAGGTLFVSGRSVTDLRNPIYLLDLPAGGIATGPVTKVNVYPEQRGLDARDLRVSSDGRSLYVATRFPNALATLDVEEVRVGDDGCVVIPPGPPVCEAEGAPTPVLANRSLVATAAGPNELTVIPRQLPGGGTSDLVVVSARDALDFVDTRTDVLAARLTGIGSVPSSVAYRSRGTGYRLYVVSFGRGTLAVIDLPDPFRPDLAQVVARLGPVQEGSF